jgi:hypothetical protein
MADSGRDQEPDEERVEERASKLQVDESDDSELSDPRTAKRAAEQILRESDDRSEEASELDPEDDSVIRRSSEDTVDPSDH